MGTEDSFERCLYGVREAASGWEDHFVRKLVSEVVERRRLQFHLTAELKVIVHSDEFALGGIESGPLSSQNRGKLRPKKTKICWTRKRRTRSEV